MRHVCERLQIFASRKQENIKKSKSKLGQTMGETILDPKQLPENVKRLQDRLNAKVIGQERAMKQIIKAYTPMTVNLHREGRPLGVFLFMGPTGVGKTETVCTFAKELLGSRDSITRIDCVEFGEHHEAAKLLGSPPGYIGYNDEPRLSQKNIDQYQTKDSKINIVLFDEIEKANDRIFDAIMTVLGDGILTLGNGKKVDFTKTFVFLTSNLGSEDVRKEIEGSGIGFDQQAWAPEELDDRIYRMSKEIVKKRFRPEFINRLDSIVVFRSLDEKSLRSILKNELEELNWAIWRSPWRGYQFEAGGELPKGLSIVFRTTEAATKFLLKEGTSDIYGARELNRALDRFVRFPLASLIATKQVGHGDKLEIDALEGRDDLVFKKVEK